MTGVMEERHLSDGAIILEKVLGFTAFSTPMAVWGHHQLFLIQMALTTAMSEAKIEMIAG